MVRNHAFIKASFWNHAFTEEWWWYLLSSPFPPNEIIPQIHSLTLQFDLILILPPSPHLWFLTHLTLSSPPSACQTQNIAVKYLDFFICYTKLGLRIGDSLFTFCFRWAFFCFKAEIVNLSNPAVSLALLHTVKQPIPVKPSFVQNGKQVEEDEISGFENVIERDKWK